MQVFKLILALQVGQEEEEEMVEEIQEEQKRWPQGVDSTLLPSSCKSTQSVATKLHKPTD